jgi:hypothetical protein
VPLLLGGVLLVVALVALIPLSLVQRYRMGTSRQRARGWLASINVVGIALSALAFLAGAAISSAWIPYAFSYSVAGLAIGCLLGIAGLALTRWEREPGSLHYTPNRWLVLGIMLLVTGRIFYGAWRAVHAWRTGVADVNWLGVSSLAGSMAAGALVLGYYLAYWIGVRRRVRRRMRESSTSL